MLSGLIEEDLKREETLYPFIKPRGLEAALIQSEPVQRLKRIAHLGAASLVTEAKHTRFQHTIGVWKLSALLFPNDRKLSVAAILHDIGHLPFSHSIERQLGYDHHELTNTLIRSTEIERLLNKFGVTAQEIIDYLNQQTVLTGKDGILGLDHLDSFLRDTFVIGKSQYSPEEILERIEGHAKGIQTDYHIADYLLDLIYQDQTFFLSPEMIAADQLLAKAILLHEKEDSSFNSEQFVSADDQTIIEWLNASHSKKARELFNKLENNFDQLAFHPHAYEIKINAPKIYVNVPAVVTEDTVLYAEACQKFHNRLEQLTFKTTARL